MSRQHVTKWIRLLRTETHDETSSSIQQERWWLQCFGIERGLTLWIEAQPSMQRRLLQYPTKVETKQSKPTKRDVNPWRLSASWQHWVPHPGPAWFVWLGYHHTPPPYSPDLAPSDFHLFTKLKEFLGGKRFSNEVDEAVQKWVKELAAEVHNTGIKNLVPRPQKWIKLFVATMLKNS